MASQTGREQNPAQGNEKSSALYQILLRAVALFAALVAAILMCTSSETAVVFGYVLDAKYSYSPAFTFFVAGNAIAATYSLLSMPLVWLGRGRSKNTNYAYSMYILDLLVTLVLIAAAAAAMSVAYVGKYGNSHTGWAAICDHFDRFCGKVQTGLIFCLMAILPYLIFITSYAKPLPQ